ncbi:MAG: chemotaxis protein [Phycisphaerales bacterium]
MSTPNNAPSILLEAGTNEVEILVFLLDGRRFGVNVAKVREVIRPLPIIDVPHKHPSVLGLFEIREHVLTLIDLGIHLGVRDAPLAPVDGVADGRSIIVTEFNGLRLGFMIDGMDRIHRVGWNEIRPVPQTPGTGAETDSLANGVLAMDEGLVLLLDFESVAATVLDNGEMKTGDVTNEIGIDRQALTVVLAEDSAVIRNQMKRTLEAAGYGRVEACSDGAKAWTALNRLGSAVDILVSDIEMPALDGHALTRRLREDGRFESTPVVLFSSLINEENARKGRSVGATLQIAKPELTELVRIVDHLTSGTPYAPPADILVHMEHDDPGRRAAA